MSHTEPFAVHPRLAADCRALGDLAVCRVLLMNDRRFPWCILVPRQPGLTELHHLPQHARPGLFEEIEAVSATLLEQPAVEKINVAALGNLVPQLHVHVVGRSAADAAWPGPVWGAGRPEPYTGEALEALAAHLARRLPFRADNHHQRE